MAVRIISGSLRGRKLEVADSLGLRPTPDRVRETVFNWLQAEIPGSRCLDLFAGSGGLGLEAYSRGAAHVTSLEMNAKVFQSIHRRIDEWKLQPHFQALKCDAYAWLRQWREEQAYDVIFIDPPFAQERLDEIISLINQKKCLGPQGLLYIERPAEQILPGSCSVVKERKAGMVVYGLYKFV